jgi:hypothetical protein
VLSGASVNGLVVNVEATQKDPALNSLHCWPARGRQFEAISGWITRALWMMVCARAARLADDVVRSGPSRSPAIVNPWVWERISG